MLHFIKSLVMGQFGDTPDSAKMLDEFGYTPRKPRAKSVKVKAAAADKAAATRVARHTLGPKAKAKVKGVVAPEPSTDGTAAQAPEAPAGNPPVPPKPTAQ